MPFKVTIPKIEEKVIAETVSDYSKIKIVRVGNRLVMTFEPLEGKGIVNRQSAHNLVDPVDPVVQYGKVSSIAPAYIEKLDRILTIGFGGGKIPSFFKHYFPKTIFDNVEIDSEVVRFAGEYFGVKKSEGFNIIIGDGREYIEKTENKYDLIYLDAYGANAISEKLMTIEYFQQVKEKLSSGGLVIQNVARFKDYLPYLLKNMRELFDNIDLYDALGTGNILIFAYNGKEKKQFELIKQGIKITNKHNYKYNIQHIIANYKIDDYEKQFEIADKVYSDEDIGKVEF